MHGRHTGNESRQQFHTMMSGATIANHVEVRHDELTPLLAERLAHVPRRHTRPTTCLHECLFVEKCAEGFSDMDARRQGVRGDAPALPFATIGPWK